MVVMVMVVMVVMVMMVMVVVIVMMTMVVVVDALASQIDISAIESRSRTKFNSAMALAWCPCL